MTSGIVVGLGMGIAKRPDEASIIRQALSEDEREDFKITEERIKIMSSAERAQNISLPFLGVFIYNEIVNYFSQNKIPEQSIFAYASSYLGYFLGRGLRKVLGKQKRELTMLINMKNDKERASDYLPQEQRIHFNKLVEDVEKKADEIGRISERDFKEATREVDYICNIGKTPYSRIILYGRLCTELQNRIFEKNIGIKLREIFEDEPSGKNLSLIKEGEDLSKLVVYEINGDIILTSNYTLEETSLDIADLRNLPIPLIDIQDHTLLGIKRVKDYRELAKIIAKREDPFVIVIRADGGLSNEERRDIIVPIVASKFIQKIRNQL